MAHGLGYSLSNSDDTTTECETSLKLKELLIFPPTGTRVIQELKRQVGLEKTRSLLQTIPFCSLIWFYAALRDTVITTTLNVIFKSLFHDIIFKYLLT